MKKLLVFSFFLTLGCSIIPLQAQASLTLADLENALMCKCDDKCGKVLINCTCDTSDKTRLELQKKLDSGLTKEQIVQIYVDKYGETVLSAPTKSGFNLTAWITPFAAIVGGGWGIRKVIQSWLRRNHSQSSEAEESETFSELNKENKFSERLQKELDNLEA